MSESSSEYAIEASSLGNVTDMHAYAFGRRQDARTESDLAPMARPRRSVGYRVGKDLLLWCKTLLCRDFLMLALLLVWFILAWLLYHLSNQSPTVTFTTPLTLEDTTPETPQHEDL